MNTLMLLSGNDMPLMTANLIMHNPKIREIGMMGEDSFYTGCSLMTFSKEKFLDEQDRNNLQDKSDFDILMSILQNNDEKELRKARQDIFMLFQLLFPNYDVTIADGTFVLTQDGIQKVIDNKVFPELKDKIKKMFCLNLDKGNETDYNPKGDMAKKIAEKLKKGREKAAAQKGTKNISVLSNYVSILAVGEQKDMNDLLNYTVYQLYDEFERYQLKLTFDMHTSALLAGAKDEKEVDNWMKDIHS